MSTENITERILVIGGTQGAGRLAALQLLEQEKTVRILTRSAAKGQSVFAGTAAEIVEGDITQPDAFDDALHGVDHIIFTAGSTRRPDSEANIRAVSYDGVRHTLTAAQAVGFGGRFVYMTVIGGGQRSLAGTMLNLVKGRTLIWRGKAEDEIRASGLNYVIVRAGILNDEPAGQYPLRLSQGAIPLTFGTRISRADVARLLVAALHDPDAPRVSVNAIWGRRMAQANADMPYSFAGLQPDAVTSQTSDPSPAYQVVR